MKSVLRICAKRRHSALATSVGGAEKPPAVNPGGKVAATGTRRTGFLEPVRQ